MKTGLPPKAIDCHLHAGLERRESLEEIFRWLREDSRSIVGLVDHAELYVESPPRWAELALAEAAQRKEPPDIAPQLTERLRGPGLFYRTAREAAAEFGEGMAVAVGLEVSGDWLEKIPPDWLEGADFLGICATQPPEGVPWGEHLAGLVHKANALRAGRPIGMVLHHPFRWRLLELARGSAERLPEAGGFTTSDARVLSDALKEAQAPAEANFASYWHFSKDERLLLAAGEAFAALRDAGARFSLGSDAHAALSLPTSYAPSVAMRAFGLGPEHISLPQPLQAALEARGGLKGD